MMNRLISPERKQAIKDQLTALGLALAVHVGFVLVLLIGTWDWQPFERQTPPVRVTLVDMGPVVEQRRAEEEAERQSAEEAERQRQAELQQQREEQERRRRQEREEQRQQELEEQRQREAEQERRDQERRRQLEAEQQRREEERRRQEERRQVEEERRRAEEQRESELQELRRQREEAQRRREEEERRMAEIAERRAAEAADRQAREEAERLRLADEQAAEDARRATLREEYESTIRELVRRNWNRPPTTRPGVSCNVKVIQIPGGEIIDATIVSPCNADDATRRSIISAVMRVGAFPYRGYENVFAREIVFTFRYDG